MQSRIRPALLKDNAYGTSYPSPTQKIIDVSTLNGGLNLWELDYRLEINQSPDLLNVYWQDGSLSSRPGQAYLYNSVTDTQHSYGNFYACYERPWQNYIIAHKGTTLYKINPSTGEHTRIYNGTLTAGAGGTFFVFKDKLYYMNGHEYIVITQSCVATDVIPYTPIVIVNRKPDGTGGSTFQDENRLSPKKMIKFTTDGTSTAYNIPSGYTPMDGDGVVINMTSPTVKEYHEVQSYANRAAFPATGYANIYYKANDTSQYYTWNGTTYASAVAPTSADTFTVNRTTGVITFNTAPTAAMTQSPSNLEVTVSKADAATQNSILNCTCVTVYGGDTQLAVVCGGTPGQPNAYFWSGSTTNGLDPTYFPFDYYNYAGANAEEYITGFGKQQSMLVIFKERSIGKSYFSTITINEMEYLKLPYTPVNENLGCDLEKSIRLIQNNLVFANTYSGVHVLLDTTAYGENTVKRISRNVNGDGVQRASNIAVRAFANRASFPTVGEIGYYYKDNATNTYYVWNELSNEYVITRLANPSSGLLYDLRQVASTGVSSFDDQQRYWLTVNGKAYVWDYTISSYSRSESYMSWFYLDNINAVSWFNLPNNLTNPALNFYGMSNGSIVKFVDAFNDFDEPIPRRYKFATQNFGTYEVLKDVIKVIFAVRSDTDSAMTITYESDYERRVDKTPIREYGWRLSPRDLTHRSLRPISFAGTAVRTPRCFHVRHFSMTLTNNTINTDMSIVNAQIVYRYSREDR